MSDLPPRSSDGSDEQQTNGNKDGPHRHAGRAFDGAASPAVGTHCHSHTTLGSSAASHPIIDVPSRQSHERRVAQRPASQRQSDSDSECLYVVVLARAARCEQA